eukprot:COSAG05_NODE_1172_length_5623_cov_3.561188_6_plen_137_part_00
MPLLCCVYRDDWGNPDVHGSRACARVPIVPSGMAAVSITHMDLVCVRTCPVPRSKLTVPAVWFTRRQQAVTTLPVDRKCLLTAEGHQGLQPSTCRRSAAAADYEPRLRRALCTPRVCSRRHSCSFRMVFGAVARAE